MSSGRIGSQPSRRRTPDVVRRGLLLVPAFAAVFAGAALLATDFIDPVYHAEARAKLTGFRFDQAVPALATDRPGSETPRPTISDFARSPEILASAAARLPRDELEKGHYDAGLSRFAQASSEATGSAPASSTKWLNTHLFIRQGPEPDLVVITVNAGSPRLASEAANSVAASLSEVRLDRLGVDAPAIEEKLRSARDRLLTLESELTSHDFGAGTTTDTFASEPADQEAKVGSDLSRAKADADALQDLIGRIDVAGTTTVRQTEPSFARLNGLIDGRAKLEASVTDLRRTLAADHPRVVISQLRLDDLTKEITDEQNGLRARLSGELANRRAEEAQLTARLEKLRGTQTAADALEAKRAALNEAISAEQRSIDALERQWETSRQTAILGPALPDAESRPLLTLVEPATAPTTPVFPNKPFAAGLAGLSGALLALLGVVISHRRGSAARAIRADRSPLRNRQRGATENGSGSPSEGTSVENVADALLASDLARVVVLTAGKASGRNVSVDLARRLALRSFDAVLIDLSPTQDAAAAMGLQPGRSLGFSDLVAGRASYAAIVQRDFATSADVVGMGREADAALPASDGNLRAALDFIERSCECMVIHCGERAVADVARVMDEDAALLVASRLGETGRRDAFRAELSAAGLHDFIEVDSEPTNSDAAP